MLPNSTYLSADKDFNLKRSFDNKIRKTKHYYPQYSNTKHLDNCENIFFLSINLTALFTQGKEYCCFPQWLSGKESTCNAEDTGDSDSIPGLGLNNKIIINNNNIYWEDPLEEEMEAHSSMPAGKIP